MFTDHPVSANDMIYNRHSAKKRRISRTGSSTVLFGQTPQSTISLLVDPIETLRDLFDNPRSELVIGEQRYPIIPNVIAKRSHYFNAMFGGSFQETDMKEITVQLPEPKEFEWIYPYLMLGALDAKFITTTNFFPILANAEFLQIDELIEHLCRVFLRNTLRICDEPEFTMISSSFLHNVLKRFEREDSKLRVILKWSADGRSMDQTKALFEEFIDFREISLREFRKMRTNFPPGSKLDQILTTTQLYDILYQKIQRDRIMHISNHGIADFYSALTTNHIRGFEVDVADTGYDEEVWFTIPIRLGEPTLAYLKEYIPDQDTFEFRLRITWKVFGATPKSITVDVPRSCLGIVGSTEDMKIPSWKCDIRFLSSISEMLHRKTQEHSAGVFARKILIDAILASEGENLLQLEFDHVHFRVFKFRLRLGSELQPIIVDVDLSQCPLRFPILTLESTSRKHSNGIPCRKLFPIVSTSPSDSCCESYIVKHIQRVLRTEGPAFLAEMALLEQASAESQSLKMEDVPPIRSNPPQDVIDLSEEAPDESPVNVSHNQSQSDDTEMMKSET